MDKRGNQRKIVAVDVFCGIGGLTRGLRDAGIDVRAGIDVDVSCAYAYEANNAGAQFIGQNVKEIEFKHIEKYYKGADVKVLVGCAPCQKFSAHRRKHRRSEEAQKDYGLVRRFLRIAKAGNFDVISMENVPGFTRSKMFDALVDKLQRMKYNVNHDIVSCLDYGVPQTRKRMVLLASRLGKISLVPPKSRARKTTVADCIKHLPTLRHGATSQTDSAHTSIRLSEKHLQRIRQSKPGGSWKDWDPAIISKCHQKAYYPAPYGRMQWDTPAPTITTQFCYYSTGRFGHPDQDRAISVREAALLQTFPKNYKLSETGGATIRDMARHVGNAVPVKLAKAIGDSIMEHVRHV